MQQLIIKASSDSTLILLKLCISPEEDQQAIIKELHPWKVSTKIYLPNPWIIPKRYGFYIMFPGIKLLWSIPKKERAGW